MLPIQGSESLLGPYRALDLTDAKGLLCGKILGDLGADVIKIERPGGDPARNIGPFYHDIPDPEKSLFWFAHNTSKRGITLNIETPDGQEILKSLAKTADFVIESFHPGYMGKLGIGYPVLSATNPRVIMISITPFGQEGPRRDWKASDLIAMAAGGQMYTTGEIDRPPLRFTIEQSYPQAGAQAAMAAMIAHHYRELTGEGQHIDVSLQECVTATTWFTQHLWHLNSAIHMRAGSYVSRGAGAVKVKRRIIFPCKDGFVTWQVVPGPFGRRTRYMIEWMDSEGMATEDLKRVNWEEIGLDDLDQVQVDVWEKTCEKFFLTHTKSELLEGAVERGIMLLPVSTCEDIVECEQLKARKFWVEVNHDELGTTLEYPGAPFQTNEASCRISRRAPCVGEHNEEIYMGELGFGKQELAIFKQANII